MPIHIMKITKDGSIRYQCKNDPDLISDNFVYYTDKLNLSDESYCKACVKAIERKLKKWNIKPSYKNGE